MCYVYNKHSTLVLIELLETLEKILTQESVSLLLLFSKFYNDLVFSFIY